MSTRPSGANDLGDPGPGVHVLVHPDPDAAGEQLGRILSAPVLTGGQAATAAAARLVPPVRAARPPAPEDPERLQDLADRLDRAGRINDATRQATTSRLAESLRTEVAVHPESLRRAATALRKAEAALAAAEQESDPARARWRRSAAIAGLTDPPPAPLPPAGGGAAKILVVFGATLLVLALAGLLALKGPTPVLGLIPIIAALGVVVVLRRRKEEGETDEADRARASDALANAAGLVDNNQQSEMLAGRESARRLPHDVAPPPIPPAGHDPLPDAVADATAELAAARTRWEALAGPGADPADLEEIIRRQDPQHDLLATLVPETPPVRATSRYVQTAQDRWKAAWDELGLPAPDPPTGPALERALDDLRARADHGNGKLVLVAPFRDLAEPQAVALKQELLAAPPDRTIVLIVRSESDIPS